MDLVLRAYDQAAVTRAEGEAVQRLWTILESGGLREPAHVRAGLTAQADVWARETIISRLEALVQEGYAEMSLAQLRGDEPPSLATARHTQWPAIKLEEAVALREDLVRYLTYGLWQAPEEVVARALGLLTDQADVTFLLGGEGAAVGLREVLEAVEDEERFADAFSERLRTALAGPGKRPGDDVVRRELGALSQLLAPVARLLRDAQQVGLRTIAYQEGADGEGLTRFLARDLADTETPAPAVSSNGNGAHG